MNANEENPQLSLILIQRYLEGISEVLIGGSHFRSIVYKKCIFVPGALQTCWGRALISSASVSRNYQWKWWVRIGRMGAAC
jgi:hypothetical protein